MNSLKKTFLGFMAVTAMTLSSYVVISFNDHVASAAEEQSHKDDVTKLSGPQMTQAPADEDHHESMGLKRVEAKQVCMMNNKFMGRDQISIIVDGKTYYGCCAMCKEKLQNDPQARTGTDPISGKPVDKATAIIGAAPDDTIYYFENEENMEKFSSDPSRYVNPLDVEP
jgi:YHS domain-containing protein